jgi:MscS family membrane protein
MLDKVFYGNSVSDWGISLLIIVAALLINKLLLIFNRKVIKRMTARSRIVLDDLLFESLEKPVLLGIILLAIWIALGRLESSLEFKTFLKTSYEILVTLNITWFFARLASSMVEAANRKDAEQDKGRFKIDSKIMPLIKRLILILVWLTGIITALKNAGVEITTLMGTLGIGGIAFALAAQDTIKNMFGGITIFIDKTFRIGDIINFSGMEGSVVDIGLRSVRILTYDKRLVTVPNYKLTDALITNISSEPGRRIVMELTLTYDTTPEEMRKAMNILADMPNRIPEIRSKDLTVAFTDFADSALILRFSYFIRKTADIYNTRTQVNFEILRAFNEANLRFAYPTQTVYLENESKNN